MEISAHYPAAPTTPMWVRVVYAEASPWQAPFEGLELALRFVSGVADSGDRGIRRIELFPVVPRRLQHLEQPATAGVAGEE